MHAQASVESAISWRTAADWQSGGTYIYFNSFNLTPRNVLHVAFLGSVPFKEKKGTVINIILLSVCQEPLSQERLEILS